MLMPKHSFIAFVRRQTPDWRGLSADWRRGALIDPGRYLPDHAIPGFPTRVDHFISLWNARFPIDFFTFRHVLVELASRGIEAVPGAYRFKYDEMEAVADLAAREHGFIYFHDDDDFFAPHLPSVVAACRTDPDAVVTPMFRIGAEAFTYVRDGCTPDFLWGPRRPHDFRFQTNNYGIASRHCGNVKSLMALKDHVRASGCADRAGFRDEVLPYVVSATIKTPGSASLLPVTFGSEGSLARSFGQFVATSVYFVCTAVACRSGSHDCHSGRAGLSPRELRRT